jgi:hypothetical protein
MNYDTFKVKLEQKYPPDYAANTYDRLAGREYARLELIVGNASLLKVAGVGFGIVSGFLFYVSPLKAHPAQLAFSTLCAAYGFRDSRKYGSELERRVKERENLYAELLSDS